jgi:hypothetical protein
MLGGIGPESKSGAPVPSAVTVCGVESSFVHETILPGITLSARGLNGSKLPSSAAPSVITTELGSCCEKASVGLDKIPKVSSILPIMLKFKIFTIYI